MNSAATFDAVRKDAQHRPSPENEDADPVGTPVPEAARQAAVLPDVPPKPRNLDQEKEDFTAEGSPPPGKVATDAPVTPGKSAS